MAEKLFNRLSLGLGLEEDDELKVGDELTYGLPFEDLLLYPPCPRPHLALRVVALNLRVV